MVVAKRKSNLKRNASVMKSKGNSVKKRKRAKTEIKNDEVSSGSEDDEIVKALTLPSESEDELETAQEKKMRLAKKYLEELKLMQDTDDSDNEKDVIGEILQEDVLEKAGKLQRKIADKCSLPDTDCIHILKGHRLSVLCLTVSSDKSILFTASKDCSIMKWCLKDYKRLGVIKGGKKMKGVCHRAHVFCLALSHDTKYLASGGKDKMIIIWDPSTLAKVRIFKGHRDSVTGLVFRLNSYQLFSSSHDRTVKVWDLEIMAYVETLYGHQDSVQACDSFNKERCITAGGRDGSLRIWKIVEESQLVYHGHKGSIDCVRFINEEHMVSGSDDGSICLWSVMRKRPNAVVQRAHHTQTGGNGPRQNWISAIATLHNSDLVATGSCDGYIRLWKCSERFLKLIPLFSIPVPGFVNDLGFVGNGSYLLAAVGQEHKLGRWWTLKESKNAVWVIPLQGN